jgi:5-formyltetrahydrofolate cyclo-ligase
VFWKPDVTTETFFQQKATIRKEILEKRKAQDPKIRVTQSCSIVRALLIHKEFQKADKVLIYLSSGKTGLRSGGESGE